MRELFGSDCYKRGIIKGGGMKHSAKLLLLIFLTASYTFAGNGGSKKRAAPKPVPEFQQWDKFVRIDYTDKDSNKGLLHYVTIHGFHPTEEFAFVSGEQKLAYSELREHWLKLPEKNVRERVFDFTLNRHAYVLARFRNGDYLLVDDRTDYPHQGWRSRNIGQLSDTMLPKCKARTNCDTRASEITGVELSATANTECADAKFCNLHDCATSLVGCGHYRCAKCQEGSVVDCVSCLVDKISVEQKPTPYGAI